MVFSGLTFLLLFFPTVILLTLFSRRLSYQNGVLLAASLLFYAWGEPKWILAMLAVAAVNYLCALPLGREGLSPALRRLFLWLAVLGSLSFLIYLIGAFVIFLFIYMLYRLLFIAENAPDLYGALIVTGVFSHIALQVVLNICVVLGILPTTGVTLPFISYGGTSVLFLMLEMALALSVSRMIRSKKATKDLWGNVVRYNET